MDQTPLSPEPPVTHAMRAVAGLWFAACGFLVTALLFLHGPIRGPAVLLYVILPALASAIAGYVLGGAILDPLSSYAAALLRGLATTITAFALFAAFFALTLPFVERGWSLTQAGGLFLTTLFFGLLMAGPLCLVAGIVASMTLHAFGHRFIPGMKGEPLRPSSSPR